MTRVLEDIEWTQFAALLPRSRGPGNPVVPRTAPYRGVLAGVYDYVPPDYILRTVREWLYERGETRLLYFITESTSALADKVNFALNIWELTGDTLAELNPGLESVLTGFKFDWALFVDHEGQAHVGGPQQLLERLQDQVRAETEPD